MTYLFFSAARLDEENKVYNVSFREWINPVFHIIYWFKIECSEIKEAFIIWP